MSRSKAVCILGMHRSGTSVMSRAVNLLGADLGNKAELLPPGKANPKGFWEHTRIIKLNHRMLRTFGRSWDSTVPLPDRWWESSRTQPIRQELKRLIQRDFGGKQLWAWKDPRTCLVIPLWQSVLREMNTDLVYVIVVRNPLDVATSLYKRNGFTLKKSLNIWAHYTLSALYWTSGAKRVIVHYDQLISDWESQLKRVSNALDIPWPKRENQLKRSMESFLDPKLQHNKSTLKELDIKGISNPVKMIYRLCLQGGDTRSNLEGRKMKEQVKHLYKHFHRLSRMMTQQPKALIAKKKSNP